MFSFTTDQVSLWIAQFIWPFVRILSLFTFAPVLSQRNIPQRVKLASAVVLTIVIAPLIPDFARPVLQDIYSVQGIVLLAEQLLVGFVMGFSLKLVFAAMETAGEFIGLQMGISFATFVDPQNARPTPIIGSLMNILAMLVFLGLNGHLSLIMSIAESFTVVPISSDAHAGFNWLALTQQGGQLFALGLHLALPIIAVIMICNMALAVLARSAPQINIFSISFAITMLAGLFALFAMLPGLSQLLETALGTNPIELLK
ncbi:flagellar biosynthetic protein FliR [Ampullimonas aquatilis]|uniref:flagellar biosynthetic protein FliR n=1 Tax=Ampullimonas aquatilis TaxID=1341549 RepID=UPI003C76CBFA